MSFVTSHPSPADIRVFFLANEIQICLIHLQNLFTQTHHSHGIKTLTQLVTHIHTFLLPMTSRSSQNGTLEFLLLWRFQM